MKLQTFTNHQGLVMDIFPPDVLPPGCVFRKTLVELGGVWLEDPQWTTVNCYEGISWYANGGDPDKVMTGGQNSCGVPQSRHRTKTMEITSAAAVNYLNTLRGNAKLHETLMRIV